MLDPSSDPLGSGWNIIQSKIAIGSGGFLEKDYLMELKLNLEFLPKEVMILFLQFCQRNRLYWCFTSIYIVFNNNL